MVTTAAPQQAIFVTDRSETDANVIVQVLIRLPFCLARVLNFQSNS